MSAFTPTFQYAPHRISVSDNLRAGAAVRPNGDNNYLGIPLAGAEAQAVIVINLGSPAVAAANVISASQTLLSATDALINGSLATAGVATLDVPRCVSVTSSDAGDTTQTAIVYGFDAYGVALNETLAFNGAATISGVKAFKRVTRVAISAALAGNLTIGMTGKLGLPYRPVIGGFVSGILNEATADSGTYVAPSRVTATATTVDVRGTYLPAGTLNGTNVFCVRIAVQNGPNNSDAYGVAQFHL